MVENKVKITEDNSCVLLVCLRDDWFFKISYFLTYGECLEHLTSKERRSLRLKATKYAIVNDVIYKKGLDGAFLRCVDKDQQEKLLNSLHNEACGGNSSSTMTTFKILRNGFYWHGMLADSYRWLGECEKCKLFSSKPRLVALPLKVVVIEEPFKK